MASTRQKRDKRKRLSARERVEKHRTGVSTSIQLPEGVSFFSVKKDCVVKMDIVPYTVPVGAKNPFFADGEEAFERTYFTHRSIGPNNDSYVCLAKTLGKACPICESRAELAGIVTTDDTLLKALLPKERQLWNVFDHSEPEKGVQVWDVSFHLFGKLLDSRVKNSDEDDDYEFFSDPEDGQTLKVTFEEQVGPGYKFMNAASIDFKSRKSPLDAEIVEAANVLDNLLIVESYDKLKAIYLQIDVPNSDEDEDEDEDERDDEPQSKPKTKAKAKPKAKVEVVTAEQFNIEKGSDVVHEEYGQCAVIKISPDGTSLTLVDEDDEVHRAVAPDEVKLDRKQRQRQIPFDSDDEPEPEEKPKAKPKAKPAAKKSPKKKPVEEEPEDNTDDDDDDENWDNEEWDEEEDDD